MISFFGLIAQVDISQQFQLQPGKSVADTFAGGLGSLFSTILPNLYILAGLILLVLIVFGGFSLIAGAGGGDSAAAEKGKKALTAAVIGFLIIVGSYFIIQIVETVTGVKILNPNL